MRQSQTTNKIIISAIPAFNDNYIWALTSSTTNDCVLVDPGDADLCIKFIEENDKTLSAIMVTHHHWDHTDGIEKLTQYCSSKGQDVSVYTPKKENITHSTNALVEGNTVQLPKLGLEFSVIELPGHTLGHIAYYSDDIIFCGDTLFSGGCGRLFEGTAQQMFESLNKLQQLPERTRVYCTHEYTLANLEFALTVEPNNAELIHYYNQVHQLREQDKITLPSSILREKQINPFLRCNSAEIINSVSEYAMHNNPDNSAMNELDTFTKLRKWKDNF